MPTLPTPFTRRQVLLATLLGPVLSGCSTVGAFNAVMPLDPGSSRIAEGVAYGEHPRQKLDIYAPDGDHHSLPVVLFIYGGSWNSGERADYAFVGRALASQGVLAVVIDYRVVPEVVFPGFVQDAAKATAWVKGHIAGYGGDPEGLFVMGHSAGAHIAAMLAVTPTYLREAGLTGRVFRGFVGLAGPYDFLPLDVEASQAAFGGYPDLQRTQPVAVASAGSPPALLAHGRDDTTVYPRNSEHLAKVLRAKGVPVTERYYPDTTHAGIIVAFARPFRDKAPVLADTMAFVRSLAVPARR
jgi:acetyl esterase/lipase